MSGPQDVGSAGEKAVVDELKSKGWIILRWDTNLPGSTDIEAQSGSKKILVQVKSAIAPNEPPVLSPQEESNIKSRATRIGAEAWEAKVWLNSNLTLIKIDWRKLN